MEGGGQGYYWKLWHDDITKYGRSKLHIKLDISVNDWGTFGLIAIWSNIDTQE